MDSAELEMISAPQDVILAMAIAMAVRPGRNPKRRRLRLAQLPIHLRQLLPEHCRCAEDLTPVSFAQPAFAVQSLDSAAQATIFARLPTVSHGSGTVMAAPFGKQLRKFLELHVPPQILLLPLRLETSHRVEARSV
jgi:hypothetical protein